MNKSDQDTNTIIGLIVIFGIIAMTMIFNSGVELVEKLTTPPSTITTTQTPLNPVNLSHLPNPRQYHFIECSSEQIAIIADPKNEEVYYYQCENGKWVPNFGYNFFPKPSQPSNFRVQ